MHVPGGGGGGSGHTSPLSLLTAATTSRSPNTEPGPIGFEQLTWIFSLCSTPSIVTTRSFFSNLPSSFVPLSVNASPGLTTPRS